MRYLLLALLVLTPYTAISGVLDEPVITISPPNPQSSDPITINLPLRGCFVTGPWHIAEVTTTSDNNTISILVDQSANICLAAGDPEVWWEGLLEMDTLSSGDYQIDYTLSVWGGVILQETFSFTVTPAGTIGGPAEGVPAMNVIGLLFLAIALILFAKPWHRRLASA